MSTWRQHFRYRWLRRPRWQSGRHLSYKRRLRRLWKFRGTYRPRKSWRRYRCRLWRWCSDHQCNKHSRNWRYHILQRRGRDVKRRRRRQWWCYLCKRKHYQRLWHYFCPRRKRKRWRRRWIWWKSIFKAFRNDIYVLGGCLCRWRTWR